MGGGFDEDIQSSELPNGGARVIKRTDPIISDQGADDLFSSAPETSAASEHDKQDFDSSLAAASEREIIVIHVRSNDPDGFNGSDLLQVLIACDMRYGDRDILHRHENAGGNGCLQFSLANMIEPGTFNIDDINTQIKIAKTNKISAGEAAGVMAAIADQNKESAPGRGDRGNPGGSSGAMTDDNEGTYCFDPNTLVQMADGSEKKIKEIQLGDQTKGGEVTGVFQFKASDEIHDYKGVVVAGSHYVKEDGKFIMVQDSPMSIKIDKIPVVYSLDTTGRRIFINDIEFADYNGDGVAKNFLTNAGVDLTGFDTEVLRQVENRLL